MSLRVITYDQAMARWLPDTEERLRAAALELFIEHGYDATTVADIAERAGLTSRTFFRYFPDKREVLFAGSERITTAMTAAVRDLPSTTSTWEAVGAALLAAVELIGTDRGWSRERQRVLESHPDLHGRELTKLAALGGVVAEALRERGVAEPDAVLAAETGMTVFRLAFAAWLHETAERPLAQVMAEELNRLQRL